MDKDIAIRIEGVSKRYEIGKQKDSSLRGSLAGIFKSARGSKDEFWALKDVSFEVKKGDVVGIIGKNGAGKSTLLKILSQITKPTEGQISINGRIASLLEVGTGFHPELTGRENIFLNGTILGMTRKEVKEKFDEIVAFSGIEKFIDTPVKHYSSGQYVRLAFSVAAHLEPEILVIDEVLAVGDAEFQKKCLGKMKDVAEGGRTVLFVSHNMAAVKNLCTKGIFLKKGKIEFVGSIDNTIKNYLTSGQSDISYKPEKIKNDLEVAFKLIEVKNKEDKLTAEFTCEDEIYLDFTFLQNTDNHPYHLFVLIKDHFGSPVFAAETKVKNKRHMLKIDSHFLTRGTYLVHAFIHIPQVKQIDIALDVCQFSVTDSNSELAIHGTYNYGNVFGKYTWLND